MKFVDSVNIVVKAGDGGAGAVTFHREKFVAMGGPAGGDGGRGGDIIFLATRCLQTLMDLTLKRRYAAPSGEKGGKKNCYGSDGEALVIRVPIGTMLFSQDDELIADLVTDDQRYIAVVGGKGGLGNARFASATNRTPRYAQPGLPGYELSLRLELRMIAQVGLVGLPNAGKSTLLNALTRANPKIASYPFTTLFPNLGVLRADNREIVVADIPGLIEGAAQGHGLGIEFLRHVERTHVLLHLVAISFDGPDATLADYRTVVHELAQTEHSLAEKPTLVLLSQCDLLDDESLVPYLDIFKANGIDVLPISSVSKLGLTESIQYLLKEVIV